MCDYDLIITTTATNRPDLHNTVFPSMCDFLDGLSCLWLINIDCISYPNSKDEDETRDNFLKIFKDWSNISPVFSSYSKGKTSIVTEDDSENIPRYSDKKIAGTYEGLYRTTQYLFEESCKYPSRYGVFWFEDDWLCDGFDLRLIDIFHSIGFGNMDYLALAQNNSISGSPGVYGNGLVEEWVVPTLNNKAHDRWMRMAERVLTSSPNPVKKMYSQFSYFRDVGRIWSEKNIGKTQREDIKNHPIRAFNTKSY